MSKGGHPHSGPRADPNSARSDRRGFTLTALPSEGYDGEVPDFPLPEATNRELDLWHLAWTYPQAHAWAREPWRWQTVAMWVRTHVVCESGEATAADKNSLHRFADQIGMTPAGLKENGWAIAQDALARKAAENKAAPAPAVSARARFKAVSGGG